MESGWESVSKSCSRIETLLSLLPDSFSTTNFLSSLVDSDRPARFFLDSYEAYLAISSALSGSGDDPLCQWLYDSIVQSSDHFESDFCLLVVSLVPLIAGLYFSHIHAFSTVSPTTVGCPSLAGFEAVLLALYSSEIKYRAGKPLLVSIPSSDYLSHHSSLYHTPTPHLQPPFSSSHHINNYSTSFSTSPSRASGIQDGIREIILSPPLDPQTGIKSTKRACIVGVAFHRFFRHISQMPPWAKIDLCRFVASWADDDCPCALSFDVYSTTTFNQQDDDGNAVSVSGEPVSSPTSSNGGLIARLSHPHLKGAAGRETNRLEAITWWNINSNNTNHSQNSYSSSGGQRHRQEQGGVRNPLPWELLQPVLRILGHCLLAPAPLVTQEIKDIASVAVRRLYARVSHDLDPRAILATQSLIQLDNRARTTVKAVALTTFSPKPNTPRSKKPKVLLVSKG